MSAASLPFPLLTENRWSASRARTSSTMFELPVSLARLIALLDENGEDDFGAIGPSQHAFKTAFLIVAGAISELGEDVLSSPVVDSQGGVRITWRAGDRQLKLVCPATRDGAVYIYQSSESGDSLRNQNVTSAVLAERLSSLISRERAAVG